MSGGAARVIVDRMLSRTTRSLLLTTAALVACAAPAVEDPAAVYTDVTSYCAARAEAECNPEVVTHCGAKDATTCAARRSKACLADVPQGTTYEASRAPDCVEAVKRAYLGGVLSADTLQTTARACDRVFSGPGAVRAPCSSDRDCASRDGLACVVALGESSGKCLAPHPVNPGAACAGEADLCAPDDFCEGKSKQCVVRNAEGAPCHPTLQPCQPGLRCPGGLFGSKCIALAPAGNPCSTAAECADGLCDKAVNAAQGNCAAQVTLNVLDAACAVYR